MSDPLNRATRALIFALLLNFIYRKINKYLNISYKTISKIIKEFK